MLKILGKTFLLRTKRARAQKKAIEDRKLAVQASRAVIDDLANFYDEYVIANPRPYRPIRKDIPRWPSGLRGDQITDQMCDERNAIVRENKEREAVFNNELAEFNRKFLKAQQEFCISRGYEVCERMVMHSYKSEDATDWDIREIQFYLT
jgi:hypothetical protein